MKTTGAETKIQKPKTKKGKRALQAREPKLVSLPWASYIIWPHVFQRKDKNQLLVFLTLTS